MSRSALVLLLSLLAPFGCGGEVDPLRAGSDGDAAHEAGTDAGNDGGGSLPDRGAPDESVPPGYSCAWAPCRDSFCRYPDGTCGSPGAIGTCTVPPSTCPAGDDPVCGCDGRTYVNPCEATKNSQSVRHKGACADVTPCGGLSGTGCSPTEYCDYAADARCGREYGAGVCQPRPTGCTEEDAPVCGCDGKTYGNACAANMAGQDVASIGACP